MHYIALNHFSRKAESNGFDLAHKVRQAALPSCAFQLQHLDALQEEGVAFELANTLDVEDEVVADATELDLALELLVSQTLSADGILEGIHNNCLQFALVALISAVLLLGLLTSDLLEANDTAGEALGKLLGIITDDGAEDLDVG